MVPIPPDPQISGEVLLAAFAAVQLMVAIIGKVVDHFLERGRTEPLEEKLNQVLANDKEHTSNMREFLSRHADNSRMVTDLYAMHKVTDDDGRPAWYFPKKMLEMGEKNLEMLREIAMAQKETVHEMKSLVKELALIRKMKDD